MRDAPEMSQSLPFGVYAFSGCHSKPLTTSRLSTAARSWSDTPTHIVSEARRSRIWGSRLPDFDPSHLGL